MSLSSIGYDHLKTKTKYKHITSIQASENVGEECSTRYPFHPKSISCVVFKILPSPLGPLALSPAEDPLDVCDNLTRELLLETITPNQSLSTFFISSKWAK